MSTGFTRTSPSPRYRALLEQYVDMHVHGERFQQIPPEQTFAGQSLPRHATAIKAMIDQHGARTILDYGSGKGSQYRQLRVRLDDGREFESIPAFWGVDSVTCYDPAYQPFSRLPVGLFDGVICTDVLEHCPEDDLGWILAELFGFARCFVFANVACYPAQKRLASGENAHCTVRSTAWWQALIARAAADRPPVRYQFLLDRLAPRPDGRQELVTDVLSG